MLNRNIDLKIPVLNTLGFLGMKTGRDLGMLPKFHIVASKGEKLKIDAKF